MVDAVEHDAASSVGTAAWEAGKGAAKWGLAFIAIGAVAGAVLAAGLGAGLGLTLLGGLGGAALGVIPTAYLGLPMAAVGALFGVAKGGSRISQENAEFRRQVQSRSQATQQTDAKQQNAAYIAGQRDGYMVGAQDAEARISQQLQAMAMQQEQAGPAAAGATAVAKAEANAKCECGPHTKAVIQREQATAAAAAAGVTPTP